MNIDTHDGEVNLEAGDTLSEETNAAIEHADTLVVDTEDEEELTWDNLIDGKNEAVNALLQQKLLLQSLVVEAKEIIIGDEFLQTAIKGLSKSYDDIEEGLVLTIGKHSVLGEDGVTPIFKTGVVKGDEYYDYLQIGGEYIAAMETTVALSTSAYLDIFTDVTSKNSLSKIEGLAEFAQDHLGEITAENEAMVQGALNELEQQQ